MMETLAPGATFVPTAVAAARAAPPGGPAWLGVRLAPATEVAGSAAGCVGVADLAPPAMRGPTSDTVARRLIGAALGPEFRAAERAQRAARR